MHFPFRNRQLVIEVEQAPVSAESFRALEGASDREIEQFARQSRKGREPRWDAQALIYGLPR